MDENTKKLSDLKQQQEELARKIVEQEKLAKQEVRDKIVGILNDTGYRLSDLFDVTLSKTTKLPAGTKYVNPDDSTQTWSGRGRAPDWLKRKTDAGAALEDFKV